MSSRVRCIRKVVYQVTVVFFLLLLTSCSPETPQIEEQTKGSISGRVILDNTETGNGGFFVSLSGTNFSAITDQQGFFEIRDVPLGSKYGLVVSKDMYISCDIRVLSSGENATINLLSEDIAAGEGSVIWKGSLTSAPDNPQENWAYLNTVESKG